VTIRVVSSCATAMTLLALGAIEVPAIAITFGPGTSSDLMSLTCDVCQPFSTSADELEISFPFR
jgi:hypothetical protein